MIPQATTKLSIPFNRPFLDAGVLEEIQQTIASATIGGDGPVCKSVEQRLRQLTSIQHVLLTTSCTHALEMGMMMLDLKPGEEVITPSFTFVSTANAILRGGGKPVFCEIDPGTLCMDPADLERRITKRTRALIPVHYAGVSAPMDELMEIARHHGLLVIEDAAQGVNALYKGRHLGGIGDAGAFSFHHTKNYVSGEGGAFTTNTESIARRAEIFREKGTNRSNFLRGEVDKYTWVDAGSSFILSDILAAVLKRQLELVDEIQRQRKHVYEAYLHGLAHLGRSERLRLPIIPEYCATNYHIFYVLLRDEAERVRLMRKLKEAGIGSTFHYVPLHSSPFAQSSLGTRGLQLPVTDTTYQRLLRLPLYPQLRDEEVAYVIEQIDLILR